jgi:predicted amidohydrolase YtcJ
VELDAALRNPTYISFGAHVVIANTLALRERGITRDSPDPQGGAVMKDPATGEPTRELREPAQFLVKRKEARSIQKPSPSASPLSRPQSASRRPAPPSVAARIADRSLGTQRSLP